MAGPAFRSLVSTAVGAIFSTSESSASAPTVSTAESTRRWKGFELGYTLPVPFLKIRPQVHIGNASKVPASRRAGPWVQLEPVPRAWRPSVRPQSVSSSWAPTSTLSSSRASWTGINEDATKAYPSFAFTDRSASGSRSGDVSRVIGPPTALEATRVRRCGWNAISALGMPSDSRKS